MRQFIVRVLLLLLILMTNKADAFCQTKPLNDTLSIINPVSTETLNHDPVVDDCDRINNNIRDTINPSQNLITQEKGTDWSKHSFYATLGDVFATVIGILAALGTLLWMHYNSKEEKKQVKQQLALLKRGNQQSKQQILNQEIALKDSAEKSCELNTALKENVEDIKKYLTQSDLKVKLTEKKDTVNSTFTSLWNSVLRQGGSKLKDGSIINYPAVLNGIIAMETGINTFNDLLPVASEKCKEAGNACLNDINNISKKKKKGEDIAEWLQNMKNHFDELNNEMSNCINNMK